MLISIQILFIQLQQINLKFSQFFIFQKMRASTSAMIQDDPLEAELMSSIGVHVGESAKIIFNIKQCLYQMVKLNVSASIPSRKYDTGPSIIAGSKRNLDDLRRVESILKGYINTLKTDSDQSQSDNDNKHSAVISNSTLSNLRNLTIQIDAKSGGGVSTKSSPKNIVNVIESSQSKDKRREESKPKLKKSLNMEDDKKGDEKTKQRQEFDIVNLRKQNIELKNEIIKMRQQINKTNINQPEIAIKKQNQKDKQEVQIGTNNKLTDIGNDIIGSKGVPILNFGSGLKQEDQNNKKQGVKSKKLKNCNSAIFSTSRNLNGIRDRNKQCLELIKIIKKQIGFQLSEA